MEFIFFNLIVILFFYLIFYFREYKRSLSLFFIIAIGTFIIQIYYYKFGGNAYRIFSNDTLYLFQNVAIIVLLQLSFLIIIKNSSLIPKIKLEINPKKSYMISKTYLDVIYYTILIYVLIYFLEFPLINLIKFNSSVRLDTSGAIPLYFTISTFAYFILPMFYYLTNKKKYIILFFVFSILSLHKGILIYNILFYWIFKKKLKLGYKDIVIVFLIIFYYLLSKGRNIYDINSIKYFFSSSIRRFFITQGSGFIVRLDMLQNGVSLIGKNIKEVVYRKIYRGSGGAPTYFLANLIIYFGYLNSLIIHFITMIFCFILSKIADYNNKNLFLTYNVFVITYLIGMSEITYNNFYRFIAIFLNLLIIVFLKAKFYHYGRGN
jgi:hypothetical protein